MLRLHCSTASPVGPHASQGQAGYDGQRPTNFPLPAPAKPRRCIDPSIHLSARSLAPSLSLSRPTAKSPPLPYKLAPRLPVFSSPPHPTQDSCHLLNYRPPALPREGWMDDDVCLALFSFPTVRFVHQMMGCVPLRFTTAVVV